MRNQAVGSGAPFESTTFRAECCSHKRSKLDHSADRRDSGGAIAAGWRMRRLGFPRC